jgi:hypothetical protein
MFSEGKGTKGEERGGNEERKKRVSRGRRREPRLVGPPLRTGEYRGTHRTPDPALRAKMSRAVGSAVR